MPRPNVHGLVARRSIDAGPPKTKFYTKVITNTGPWNFSTEVFLGADGSRYTRADGTTGCSVWDPVTNQWVPYLTATNLLAAGVTPGDTSGGVRTLAVAPTNPRRVYLGWNGAIWRSDTGLRAPTGGGPAFSKILDGIRQAPNGSTRNWDGASAADPANADVAIIGTQFDGLQVTRTGGRTWAQTQPTLTTDGSTLPPGVIVPADGATDQDRTDAIIGGVAVASAGISSVIFDPSSPLITVGGVTCTSGVWLQIYGVGIFHSTDAAQTFTPIAMPTSGGTTYKTIRSLKLMPDGALLGITMASETNFDTSDVWRRSPAGAWTMVLHNSSYGYRALAVNPANPAHVVVMASGGGSASNRMSISTNGGQAWATPASKTADGTGDVVAVATALNTQAQFTVGNIVFDPTVRNRLWMGDGIAVWYVDLPEAPTIPSSVDWHVQARGITGCVINWVCYAAAKLLAAVWDRRLFGIPRLSKTYDALPGNGLGVGFSSGWHIPSSPDGAYIGVIITNHQDALSSPPSEDSSLSGRSTDGGASFAPWPTIPNYTNAWVPTGSNKAPKTHNFGFGSGAVTAFADGTGYTVLWCPAYGNRPAVTASDGSSWAPLVLPKYAAADYSLVNNNGHTVGHFQACPDQVTPDTIYLLVAGSDPDKSGIFTITQKGTNAVRTGPCPTDASGQAYSSAVQLSSAPGNAGHLWLCGSTSTFRRSTNGAASWSDVTTISDVSCFGFGAAMPGTSYPALYVAGTVNGVPGLYRSTDAAQTMTLLKRYPGDKVQSMESIDADKVTPGRVLIGFTSGLVYGEDSPVTDNAAA